jgi:hypothetical protein
MRILATAALFAASFSYVGEARADGDHYCDFVEGVASAQSSLLFAPELFGTFGYLDQQAQAIDVPEGTTDDLRLTAGVRYSLGNVYEGFLTRGRARAECKRKQALDRVQGATTYRALEARAKVLDEAIAEADKLLAEAKADLDSRRATSQEVIGTRVRVDELRAMAAATRKELAAAPPAADGSMDRAMGAYLSADAAVERHDASLRKAQAWDVSVRFGYDQFLSNDVDESPLFALVQANFNLGWFLQGSGNGRAARGRRALVMEGRGGLDATESQLRAVLAIEERRAEETGALVADLDGQLAALRQVGGDASRRARQTVWFEWVKIKAEHEFLTAHVASLRQVLGEESDR